MGFLTAAQKVISYNRSLLHKPDLFEKLNDGAHIKGKIEVSSSKFTRSLKRTEQLHKKRASAKRKAFQQTLFVIVVLISILLIVLF